MVGGATLEVTTAQFWSQLGEATLEQEVEFHGVTADPSAAFIDGSAGAAHPAAAAVLPPPWSNKRPKENWGGGGGGGGSSAILSCCGNRCNRRPCSGVLLEAIG